MDTFSSSPISDTNAVMQTTTRSGQHCRGHVDWLVLGTSDIRKPSVGCLAQQLGEFSLCPLIWTMTYLMRYPKQKTAPKGVREISGRRSCCAAILPFSAIRYKGFRERSTQEPQWSHTVQWQDSFPSSQEGAVFNFARDHPPASGRGHLPQACQARQGEMSNQSELRALTASSSALLPVA